MTANARHSSVSNEHYTPPAIVEAARATMGRIDLDPASCALANEVVQAPVYWSALGLMLDWHGSVLLNPPGGLLHPETLEPLTSRKGLRPGEALSSQAVWWTKLWSEWHAGRVEQAVFVCFNLEVLRLTQDLRCAPAEPACAFPICFLSERPMFWNEGTPIEKRGLTGDPTHAGAVVYLPPGRNAETGASSRALQEAGCERFEAAFKPLGYVRI